jgi:hypothetical protein
MVNGEETDYVTITNELARIAHESGLVLNSKRENIPSLSKVFDYIADEGWTTEAVTEGRYIKMYLTFKGLWISHSMGLL